MGEAIKMKFRRGNDGAYLIDYEDGEGLQPVDQMTWGGEKAQRDMIEQMGAGERFLVGAGKTFTDWGRGAKNLYARATDDEEMLANAQQSQFESDDVHAPFMDRGGFAGKAGAIAPAALTGLVGGTGLVGVATQMGIGTGLGMIENPDEMVEGGAWGAGTTAVGYGLGGIANRVVTTIGRAGTSARNVVSREAIRKGQEAGLEFSPGQLSQSRPQQIMEERLRRTPAYAGIDAERMAANQVRLNELAAETLGQSGEAISPQMLGDTAKQVGKVFDSIAEQSEDIILDGARLNDLAANLSEPAEALMNRMRMKHPAMFDNADTGGQISGKDFNNARNWLAKQLRLKANTQSGAADELGEVMGILDDGLEAANPQLAQEIAAARKQWKALLIVQDSLRGAQASATGNVQPLGAYQALRKYDKRGFERGGTVDDPFQDAVRAMAATSDITPQTGVNPGTFGGGILDTLLRRPVAENYMRGGQASGLLMGLTQPGRQGAAENFGKGGIATMRALMAAQDE
jgi:hypothetical protein